MGGGGGLGTAVKQERVVTVKWRRDLEIVSEQDSHARFPQKHERGRHPKIPCILVPALGWRKLFTLSISHC